MVHQCAVFESDEKPQGVTDLKKVEVREGTRSTGIIHSDDIAEECEDNKNPQDDMDNLEEELPEKRYDSIPPVPMFAHTPKPPASSLTMSPTFLCTRY